MGVYVQGKFNTLVSVETVDTWEDLKSTNLLSVRRYVQIGNKNSSRFCSELKTILSSDLISTIIQPNKLRGF